MNRTMKKKVAIIGANEQQNPLILKAKEMGLETHTFAWQTGSDIGEKTSDFFYPISAGNKDDILSKCAELEIDAVISIGSDIAARSAAYVAQQLKLPGNSYEDVRAASNKLTFRKKLAENGIPQPDYAEIGDVIPFDALKSLNYPLVVKPSDRSGARGLSVIADASELISAINTARDISFERKAIVEEYVNGQLYSCECISVNGKHHIVALTQRDVRIIGGRVCEYNHSQPALLPHSVCERMREFVNKILSCLNLGYGAASIEFIVDSDNNVFIVELTPSMYGDYIGTDLVPLSYGYDYTGAVLNIACGNSPAIPSDVPKMRSSVLFTYNEASGVRGGYTVSSERIKEFGGCLPLRINPQTPYFSEGESILALNSEYTAFWYALKKLAPRCVHIPHYASGVWDKIADEIGVEHKHYHIGENFLPTDVDADENDAVFLINYHGLCSEYIKNAPYKNKIIDNSMVFFEAPIMQENVYNIYCARKFFAVPDGAYLISKSISDGDNVFDTDISYKRARMLLRSLELGPGEAYKEQQTNEQELVSSRKSMSVLTRKLLECVDYEKEKHARIRNFNTLHNLLKQHNKIPCDFIEDSAPQFYPLLVSADIRSLLIDKKIYIPLMWRKTLSEEFESLAEKIFSERLISLPIEPDYSESDMEYLAKTVIALLT